ncbi:MAG TPA: mismatch repair protein [Terriglobales bacterium]|nr:mismatch repair protein [Terriglobales bacterium]
MSPADEYARRLQERELSAAQLERLHIRIGYVRLLIGIAVALMAWWAFARHAFSGWWLAAPIAAFAVVAARHAKILQARIRAERAAEFYRRGLSRIEDRWAGTGESGERFQDLRHVYAADLDLFGNSSLFQLLSAARTRMGEDTLASWLLAPAGLQEILERQAAVADLRERLDLREDVGVLGEGVGIHPEALLQWAEGPVQLRWGWVRVVAPILAALAVATAVIWGVWGSMLPFFVVIGINVVLARRLKQPLEQTLFGTEHAFEDLDLLSAVLARLEREAFSAPRLQSLGRQLISRQLPPSRSIGKLRTIIDFIYSRDNMFLRVIDLGVLYTVQVGFWAEAWRRRHGAAVRRWLEVTGQMEALISLATYSYEHPADPFPEFATGGAIFEAEDLGHPLIAADRCVRNSLQLGSEARVLLVSGSNMSGKSTLLRAVGVNAVLAMTGAPVRARRLRLSPLQVGASIRINDSLQEGSSHFYAEITRLRRLFDLAGKDPPLLFLLDELLQGTNSMDRRIGAEGIVRALVERGAIGLVTTHDLALAEISGPLNGHIHNVHFQDELDGGRIRFDYRLRPGVVAKSNGLELMRSIGLDV